MSTTVTITVDGPALADTAHAAELGTFAGAEAPSMEPQAADVAASAVAEDEVPTLVPEDQAADQSTGDADASGEAPDPSVVVDDELAVTADASSAAPGPSIDPS